MGYLCVKLEIMNSKIKRSKEVGEERIIENREEAKIEREIVESRVTREIIGVKKNGKVERIQKRYVIYKKIIYIRYVI